MVKAIFPRFVQTDKKIEKNYFLDENITRRARVSMVGINCGISTGVNYEETRTTSPTKLPADVTCMGGS